jgi:hypothetical protein
MTWGILFNWLFTHALGRMVDGTAPDAASRSLVDEWLLGKPMTWAFQEVAGVGPEGSGRELDAGALRRAVEMVKILISHHGWCEAIEGQKQQAYDRLVSWLRDGLVQQFIQVNRFDGILWFNKEAFEQFLDRMLIVAAVEASAQTGKPPAEVAQRVVACYKLLRKLNQAADASEYQVAGLLEAARE